MRFRRFTFAAALACWLAPLAAQAQTEPQLEARAKLFPELTTGVEGLKHGADGRYFVLTTHAVLIYDPAGRKLAEFPAAPARNARPLLVYAQDVDLDSSGRVYVADRGGNALRIFSSSGVLETSIPVEAPTGVVVLSAGEIAVATTMQDHLVTVFDNQGRTVRQFGQHVDVTESPTLNNFLNSGRLATDARANLYYAFSYLPEPTFRRYDRYGYASLDASLTGLEFMPDAQAARKVIAKRQAGGNQNPRTTIAAFGVDGASGQMWAAMGDLLMLLDSDGNRTLEYRAYTALGARLAPNAILVEPERLLLISDLLGVFEFARPDKPQAPAKAAPGR